jgi:hypothetical protein
MGRKVLLPVLSAPCRVRLVLLSLYCGTSFQHALYRLMRNLLKISSCAAGVNGGAPMFACLPLTGASNRPASPVEKEVKFAVSHISRKTSEMWGTHQSVAGTDPKRRECSIGMLASVVNVCALSPTMALNSAPPRLHWIGCDGSCRRSYRLTRAKPSKPF